MAGRAQEGFLVEGGLTPLVVEEASEIVWSAPAILRIHDELASVRIGRYLSQGREDARIFSRVFDVAHWIDHAVAKVACDAVEVAKGFDEA